MFIRSTSIFTILMYTILHRVERLTRRAVVTTTRRGGREEKDIQKRKRQLLCITRTSGPALLALKADLEEVRTEKDRTAGTEKAHPDVLQLQNKLSFFFGCLSFSSFYHHGRRRGRASSVLSFLRRAASPGAEI